LVTFGNVLEQTLEALAAFAEDRPLLRKAFELEPLPQTQKILRNMGMGQNPGT
jgi:hypothetical protein